MKKTYMSPLCEEIKLNNRYSLLSNSNSIKGMGDLADVEYGGVDENGELDPASREFDEFDEDFDDEEF